MKTITLGSSSYSLPQNGEDPTWGEQLSDLVEAMADTLNGAVGTYDSLNKLFLFTNNMSATDIPGASIDPVVVNGAIMTYSCRRVTSSVTATEVGQITITYNSSNPSSAKFDFAHQQAGSAGLTFTITDAGAVQIASSNLAGTSHVGRLRFSIKAFEI